MIRSGETKDAAPTLPMTLKGQIGRAELESFHANNVANAGQGRLSVEQPRIDSAPALQHQRPDHSLWILPTPISRPGSTFCDGTVLVSIRPTSDIAMPTMTSTVARGNGPFPTVNLVQRPRPLGWMQRVEDGHQECVPLYYQGNTRVVINGPTMRHHEPLLPGSTLAVESAPGYTYSAGLEFAKPQPWSLLPSHATLARSANATATPAESATSQSTIAPHNEVRETSMMSPTCLSCPSTDDHFLNDFQTVLRLHIEAFAASPVDVQSRSRGRGKRIQLHQVGVRCRHCAHLPLSQRSRGSTYFPMSTLSFYQAAQHIYSKHFDCGRCTKMPQSVLVQFPRLQGAPGSVGYNSAGGRQYWSQCALDLGLINTDAGVFPHDNFHNMSLP